MKRVDCVLPLAFGMDQEIPEYDMDSEDEQWLNRQVKHLKMDVSPLKFESMMDRLEKGSGQMVCAFVADFFLQSVIFCSAVAISIFIFAVCFGRFF